jgi:RHS repeat-associated protein
MDVLSQVGLLGIGLTMNSRGGATVDHPESSYYRARYYDAAIGRFLSEDPVGFKGGGDFYAYVGSNPTNRIDPLGLLQLCCRPARSVTWTGAAACHCFLKLSDGTTLGAYFKLSTYLMLEKKADYGDDKNPQDKPTCKDIPGSDCKVRQAFDALPQYQFYGLNGSSNSIPQRTLAGAGNAVEMPSCAWGAIPFNPGTFSGNRFGYVPWFR